VLREYISDRPSGDPVAQVVFFGKGHLNAVGNALAARKVFDHLQEKNMLMQEVENASGHPGSEPVRLVTPLHQEAGLGLGT